MHPLWIHTFFKGHVLGPKMVGVWQGSTPSMDNWNFFQHKITLPISYIKKMETKNKSNSQYIISKSYRSKI